MSSSSLLPAAYQAGLRANLYRTTHIQHSPLGLLAKVDAVTITAVIDTTTPARQPIMRAVPEWSRICQISDNSAPAVALVVQMSFGVRRHRLVPIDEVSPISHNLYERGGAFAYVADERFTELCGGWHGAIAVDDVPVV